MNLLDKSLAALAADPDVLSDDEVARLAAKIRAHRVHHLCHTATAAQLRQEIEVAETALALKPPPLAIVSGAPEHRIARFGRGALRDFLELHKDALALKLSLPQGMLHDYESGDALRLATAEENAASREAAELDGGAGVILVDGRRCFVQD